MNANGFLSAGSVRSRGLEPWSVWCSRNPRCCSDIKWNAGAVSGLRIVPNCSEEALVWVRLKLSPARHNPIEKEVGFASENCLTAATARGLLHFMLHINEANLELVDTSSTDYEGLFHPAIMKAFAEATGIEFRLRTREYDGLAPSSAQWLDLVGQTDN